MDEGAEYIEIGIIGPSVVALLKKKIKKLVLTAGKSRSTEKQMAEANPNTAPAPLSGRQQKNE